MTYEELQNRQTVLENTIRALITEFEQETGAHILFSAPEEAKDKFALVALMELKKLSIAHLGTTHDATQKQ